MYINVLFNVLVSPQSEIQELERTRESMARELVSLTNQNELLEEQLKEYPEFVQKYKVCTKLMQVSYYIHKTT